jgi:aryl-alcohol dehydrogenase
MGFRMDGSTTYTMDEAPLHGQFLGQSSFSAYALATERNAVKVAPGTDLSRLGPYGCSFMTGAGTVLNILDPKRGSDTDTLVVYGVGAVGLAALAAARGRYQTFAVDLQASRLEAAVRLGATAINPAESEDLVAQIKELTNGHGANFAIDTTGKTAVVKQMVQALAIKGTAVILALGDATAELDAVDVMMNGKQIVGAIMGDSDPHQTIPELLRMAAAGEFMVDDLITAYPVAQINEAIADAESGKVIKPVLVW